MFGIALFFIFVGDRQWKWVSTTYDKYRQVGGQNKTLKLSSGAIRQQLRHIKDKLYEI